MVNCRVVIWLTILLVTASTLSNSVIASINDMNFNNYQAFQNDDDIIINPIFLSSNISTEPSNKLNSEFIKIEYAPIVEELWVDDDYNSTICNGHIWGFDAFNSIQAAIYAGKNDKITNININPGNYYERITIDRPVRLIGSVTPTGEILTNISGAQGETWALICVSANDLGAGDSAADRDCFPAQGLQAYYTLKSLGYDDDHIILMLWHDDELTTFTYNCEPNDDNDTLDEYISIYDGNNNWLFGPDGQPGVAGVDDDNNGEIDDLSNISGEYPLEFCWPGSDDPVIDVKNLNVTKLELKNQIINLSQKVSPKDQVLFYFVNHGRIYGKPASCHIFFEDVTNGVSEQYLSAEELDTWLDLIKCKRMDILIDMCRGRNFVESSDNFTKEDNRLIIGASGNISNIAHAWYNANSYHYAGSWFFHPFWEYLKNSFSIKKAYEYALKVSDIEAENYPYPYQYPFLIDKIQDYNVYKFQQYGGNIINFANNKEGLAEIENCRIIGDSGKESIGINYYNTNVETLQILNEHINLDYFDLTSNSSKYDSTFFDVFPSNSSELNHSLLIGGTKKFSRINFNLAQNQLGKGGGYCLEYAKDRNNWSVLNIESDTTSNLSNDGDIYFTPPIDWAYQSHNHSLTFNATKYGYWVRLRLIDEYETIPKGDSVALSSFYSGRLNIINNEITNQNYGIFFKGFELNMAVQDTISGCNVTKNKIHNCTKTGIYISRSTNLNLIENECNWNLYHGIGLYHTSNLTLDKNLCYNNNWSGIHLTNSTLSIITTNSCKKNDYGCTIVTSDNNIIQNNDLILNLEGGINIWESDNTTISENNCSSNDWYGINLWNANNTTIKRNDCNEQNWTGIFVNGNRNKIIDNNCNKNRYGNGIVIQQNSIDNILYGNTCNFNFENGIYTGGSEHKLERNICFSNYRSGIYLIGQKNDNRTSNVINDNICNKNNWSGLILIDGSNFNVLRNNTCLLNNMMGIILDGSSNNMIINSSFEFNSNNDFYLEDNAENNIAINTTFLSIFIGDDASELIIKNFLHLKIEHLDGSPFSNVDIKITDNEKVVYSTQEFNGMNQKSDQFGLVQWILLIDRIYEGNSGEVVNITIVTIKQNNIVFWSNDRDIDMSKSHIEYFFPNSLPESIKLISPLNNSNHNSSTPLFKWTSAFDNNSDQLRYIIQIDMISNDWTKPIINDKTYFGAPNWTTITPIPDGQYKWRVKAVDPYSDGLWSEIWYFFVDTNSPYSTIKFPKNGLYYQKLPNIKGTVFDHFPSSGIEGLEIQLICTNNGQYWSDTLNSWIIEPSWFRINHSQNWTYNTTNIQWTSGSQYIVYRRVYDSALNYEISNEPIKFNIDFGKPLSVIDTPKNNSYLNKLDNISGISLDIDGSGIEKIEISILDSTTSVYWHPDGWDSKVNWLTTNGKHQWHYNSNNIEWMSDHRFRVQVRAMDAVGNIEDPMTFVEFIYDNLPPVIFLSINNGNESTNNKEISLDLFAEDNGSGLLELSVSADETNWININDSIVDNHIQRHIMLSGHDGFNIIYFKASDKAYNTARCNDSIILDTHAPHSLSIKINNGSLETCLKQVYLTLMAEDEISMIIQMSFSLDNVNWTPWELFTNSKYFNLTSGDGMKFVYFRVKDSVGNIAQPVWTSIILNTSITNTNDNSQENVTKDKEITENNLVVFISLIVIIIIIIILTLIIIKTRKKKPSEYLREKIDTEE